jgi:hypothetical protein
MSQQGGIAPKESAPELVASVTCPTTSSSNAQEGPRQAVSAAEKMVKKNVGISLVKPLNINSNIYLFSNLSLPILDTALHSSAKVMFF